MSHCRPDSRNRARESCTSRTSHRDSRARRVGRVYFSRTGKTLYYRSGLRFQSLKGAGFKANYFDVGSGAHFWISGVRKDRNDRLYGGNRGVEVDDDVSQKLAFAAELGFLGGRQPHMRTLGISLTAAQERAVRRLVKFLDEAAICYQFAGGFAGNLHGSSWPLHDIDVEVSAGDLPRLANILAPYLSRPLGPYEDEEFRLYLFRAVLEGVEVEVNQVECASVRCNADWVPLQTDLKNRQRMSFLDLQVWVQPLQGLIDYKSLLGRSADVAELRSLQRRTQNGL